MIRWIRLIRSVIRDPARLRAAWTRLAQARKTRDSGTLDAYLHTPPSYDAPFKLFEGEWSSAIPGYGGGNAALFDDPRMKWFAAQCGGLEGKRVLELGPLEAAHTCMMANAGASVTAIESNTRAFLKCLIVQNALKFKADFLLGDFRPYLATCTETYDVLIASGVLYHMTDPVGLLKDAARISNAIGLWTHFYDAEAIAARKNLRRKFDAEPRIESFGSRRVVSHRQNYLKTLRWKGFCGGSEPTSYWLTRESLLGVLDDLGFAVTIDEENMTHPNGPCITLFAKKRATTRPI